MTNFSSPYFSVSIRDFWSRWHISLSTWFRDYVYIPLGGNRRGRIRRNINTLITFLLSGLWHGANMTFVLWGLVHGIGQIIENVIGVHKSQKQNLVWVIRVFVIFVFCTLAWVLFRSNSIREAIYVYTNMLHGITSPIGWIKDSIRNLGIGRRNLLFCLFVVILLGVYDYLGVKTDRNYEKFNIDRTPRVVRISMYYMLVIVCIYAYIHNAGSNQFVYFQF